MPDTRHETRTDRMWCFIAQWTLGLIIFSAVHALIWPVPDLLRWGIGALLAPLGALGIYANYVCLAKRSSMLPPLGGACIALALLVCPVRVVAYFAWAPLLIDPAGLLLLVGIAFLVVRKLRQKGG